MAFLGYHQAFLKLLECLSQHCGLFSLVNTIYEILPQGRHNCKLRLCCQFVSSLRIVWCLHRPLEEIFDFYRISSACCCADPLHRTSLLQASQERPKGSDVIRQSSKLGTLTLWTPFVFCPSIAVIIIPCIFTGKTLEAIWKWCCFKRKEKMQSEMIRLK